MTEMNKVRAIARKLKEREINLNRLEWTQYTTGFDFGVSRAQREYLAVLKDRDNYRAVLRLRDSARGPKDRRRAEILYRIFQPYHLSPKLNRLDERIREKTLELSKLLNRFRFRVDGREVRSTQISQILRSHPDRKIRKKAFLSRAQINRPLVEAGFLDLISMRREFASLYGAKDFVAYRLERDELSEKIFQGWPQQAARLRPARERINRELGGRYLRDEKVMPWDTAYLGYRMAPELDTPVNMANFYEPLRKFFLLMGFDLDGYAITYDIFPRRHKSEWGYNFTIEEGRDSRVLANLEGRFHELGVLLHETGHALHSFLLDPGEIILNLGVSGIISEGLANLFGDLQYHPRFYGYFLKGSPKKAGDNLHRLRSFQKANAFAAMCGILFDQELYRQPLKSLDDINHLYWQVHRLILDEGPYAPEPTWGFRIHHTTHPIYLHNYFLGDLTNQMLKKTFSHRFRVNDPLKRPRQFGDFIYNQVIKPSGLYPFLDLFERISGRAFSLEYLEDR